MSESYEVVLSITCDKSRTYNDFVDAMRDAGLINKYELKEHPYPELSLRDRFIDRVLTDGFGSMLNFTMSMEDVTSPSMAINDVEAVIERFVAQLFPANRLVIVDPYFYKEHPKTDIAALLQRLMGSQASTLTDVFIVHEHGGPTKVRMHAALRAVAPAINVHEIQTSAFHDRFWINPDAGSGIVMGTSLNGMGLRIALVDKLGSADVQQLLVELRAINVPV